MKTAALMELTNIFLKKLASSTEIEEWCMATYNKPPCFILGMDYNDPPSIEECPFIVIVPNEKTEGHIQNLNYTVNIAWSIHNENTVMQGNITKFSGIEETDILGQKIIKEITAALQNSAIETIEYTIDAISQYPQFPGEMNVSVKVPNTIGGKINF